MKTKSIAILRDDGTLAILATLNNNDEHLSPIVFQALCEHTREVFHACTGETVLIVDRSDATDYVELTPSQQVEIQALSAVQAAREGEFGYSPQSLEMDALQMFGDMGGNSPRNQPRDAGDSARG